VSFDLEAKQKEMKVSMPDRIFDVLKFSPTDFYSPLLCQYPMKVAQFMAEQANRLLRERLEGVTETATTPRSPLLNAVAKADFLNSQGDEMSKHTPISRWTVSIDDACEGDGILTFMIDDGIHTEEQLNANKNLIAAAPELLQIAKYYRDLLVERNGAKDVLETVNQAIAKAEGR
jgi:hypothetical protein